ncbi:MAG: glycosyltransferase family 4 protein [Alphaproteobacteria bacterium]|uniref:Glycosyltransferase family 4 protein n=1 Tax=Candidatus Nitrobium versatile TaxID=2884831 RepID=A0A953J1X5_9BACT|nr:glycosyltransferase family 4 protein [Candidatus Nitrobium versatile]
MSTGKIRLLVVARWPLGGIRTYMRYVYKHLSSRCTLTIVAASTLEDEALERDAEEIGARLIVCPAAEGKYGIVRTVFRELRKGRHDVIQSNGFISALLASAANFPFRVPHIVTVHGIFENRHLKGRTAGLQAALLSRVLRKVTVLYAVSDDIMEHLHETVPSLARSRCRKVVIRNGIDTGIFDGIRKGTFRERMGLNGKTFLIGYLGRFMPEKGFPYLIDAVDILERSGKISGDFRVIAVGSGDYLDWYRKKVKQKELERRFVFLPFQKDVAAIYRDMDVVVMPSRWEAFPLQPMEAMCAGTPLVASDCMGLREAVRDTPAVVFRSENAEALARALQGVMENPPGELFEKFRPVARERFDVRKTAEEVYRLLVETVAGKGRRGTGA